jgi:site-specific recombinase XerD
MSHPADAPGSAPPSPAKPRRRQHAPAFLQEAEIKRLFAVITAPRDRAAFELAYRAGLRASEVGMLQMRDYDDRVGKLNVQRLKGSNDSVHHLVRPEARVLRAWLRVRGSHPGPIFPSNRHRGISRKRLDALMKSYGAQAEIPPKLRHFHILKHSCAQHLLLLGRNVEEVQYWLGHRNIQSTMAYSAMSEQRAERMADQLRDTWR